ncbi:conserved hypothetical protein [Uncinocarpus reesii 1704]|uniref:Uncharacterized protein n=1 Tax=Uncinocarpus reesii (strain UAMH 1704) TaxID=336963 RepID=C4JPX2_UNCRE|nr:uncharacterized protein UREG_04615 [Uncinocarpus reesii 1704]EEP79769.1 conserved hypothetical protein [Uncinocarpus reesii 1704]
MSFGFSISDFLTTLELANKIRKDFVGAPSQFKSISDEVRSLSIILQDLEINLSPQELNDQQQTRLQEISSSCRTLLDELKRTVEKYRELECTGGSLTQRTKRVWKQLRWEPDDVHRLNQRQEDQERCTILDWLTSSDYGPQQSGFLNRHQAGTGQWFLHSEAYQTWLQTAKQTLFCPGFPGAGKTILTAIVIDDITRQFHDDPNIGIAYLYCDFRRRNEQRFVDLLAGLLKQLVQERTPLPDIVRVLYSNHKKKRTRPSFDEISGAFRNISIAICCHDENFLGKSRGLQQVVKAKIVEATKGMFLLAHLHLSSLMRKTTEADLLDALERLPKGSEAYIKAYEDAMVRIEEQNVDGERLAKRVLMWIVCARQLLSTAELQHALAVAIGDSQLNTKRLPDLETMVSVCAGLVTIDEENSIIRLVHYTTQQYFDETRDKWFPDAQTDIMKICVTYLSFDIFERGPCQADEEFEERLESNKLYRYAAHNWGHHARQTSIVCQEIMDLLDCSPKVEASIQALTVMKRGPRDFGYSQKFPRQMAPIHLAAYFGIEELVKALLQEGAMVDATCVYGRTPLSWAAENGHTAIVQLLIEKNADVQAKDKYGRTPLSKAKDDWNTGIVKLLLDKGAGLEITRTPLSRAAENGHAAIIKLLLENGADFEANDKQYDRTPLLWAVQIGNENLVKMVLERGISLETSRTPLSWAAENGHETVVQLLLEKGANPDAKSDYGGTPLSYAARNGHETVVKLLLERRADVETKDDYGGTPLSDAVKNRYPAIVKLLLDYNAGLEERFEYGWTVLSYAAQVGDKTIVKLLLEKDANVHAKDDCGGTPVSWAAERNYEIIFKLLLEKCSAPETRYEYDGTSLSAALDAKQAALVRRVFNYEPTADLEEEEDNGGTQLSRTAKRELVALVKRLHDITFDPEREEAYRQMSLLIAAESEPVDQVKYLLERGDDIEMRDVDGWTPLLLAAWYGREAIVKLLIKEGAEIEVKERRFGWTPLICACAAEDESEAVVKLLLEANAKTDARDTDDRTPLIYAAVNGYEAVARQLLEAGANIEAKDKNGWTPLVHAAWYKCEAVFRLLCEMGAIINLKE